jgi:hypothetical protein
MFASDGRAWFFDLALSPVVEDDLDKLAETAGGGAR